MTFPPSPPYDVEPCSFNREIDTAERLLKAQADAIQSLSFCFNSQNRQDGPAAAFEFSLRLLKQTVLSGGKIVLSGMGKSHKIGTKIVATLHSFGIAACSLHPSDALHGDLGQVHRNDVLVMISASGNSPELSALLRHLPDTIQTITLTCNPHSQLAKISNGIIYAPMSQQQKEQELYGLPAPTITTTLCLVLGDAMCITLYESLENDLKKRHSNFSRWHPGGAIGLANGQGELAADATAVTEWGSVPQLQQPLIQCREVDLWRSVALCQFVCAAGVVHKSQDVIMALETKTNLASVPGFPVQLAPRYRGDRGLCIYRDETGNPTGIVWD